MVAAQTVARSFPEHLAHERTATFDSFDAAIWAAGTDFHYQREEIALDQLFPESDLILRWGGERFWLTEKTLEDLCSLLGIPISFAKAIPLDLFRTITARLKELHGETIVVIYRDGVVLGLLNPTKWMKTRGKLRPHYRPATAAEILRAAQAVWGERPDAPRITLSDAGFSIQLLDAELKVEPRIGDVTRLGVVITGTETGGPLPQARAHTLRLMCVNGATLPEEFGLSRFSSDWRVAFETRLAGFENELRSLSLQADFVCRAYERLIQERLTDVAFYNLYRSLRHIYRHAPNRDVCIDQALGVTREQRQEIVAMGRKRQLQLRRGDFTASRPQVIDLSAWDTFNYLTAAARGEPLRERTTLERLAGAMVRSA